MYFAVAAAGLGNANEASRPLMKCSRLLLPIVCRGYEGDGSSCNANQKAIDELKSVFWSQPDGLACDAGDDVDWPVNGPGEAAGPA